MDIENINADNINTLEDAKKVIKQITDCIFVLNKDIQRQLNHLTSKNVVSLDFNLTRVQNVNKLLNKEE